MSQTENRSSGEQEESTDPRWSVILALLAMGGLFLAVPARLTAGPNWLLLAVIIVLLIPAIASRRAGRKSLNFVLGLLLSAVITAAMIWSLGMLIAGLIAKRETPTELLRGGVALWFSNILVFASWYWRLDAGGPNVREGRPFHTEGDFLFPQMMMPKSIDHHRKSWKPGFVDYLFLAFNTSTAFSPTDVPVLSRWAKLLMMVQSVISLGTVALLVGRAINVL